MDDTQANIETAEYFMGKKYRGDADTTTMIQHLKFCSHKHPNNYNNVASNITNNNPA